MGKVGDENGYYREDEGRGEGVVVVGVEGRRGC